MSLQRRIQALEIAHQEPDKWLGVTVYHHPDGSISSVFPNTPVAWAAARRERTPGYRVILIIKDHTEEELEEMVRQVPGS